MRCPTLPLRSAIVVAGLVALLLPAAVALGLDLWFDDAVVPRSAHDRRRDALELVLAQAALLVVILLPLLRRRLLGPIERLKRQASAMAWRNNLPLMVWRRRDELGELGRHLNQVAQRVDDQLDDAARKRSELEALALYDPLTGLPNRSLFNELLQRELKRAQRDETRLALMHLDLDHYDKLVESVGHAAGDELLRALAARLQGVLRDSDAIARGGPHRYAILLRDCGSWDETAAAANRVLQAVATPVQASGCSMQVTGSAGIVLYPDDAADARKLGHYSDMALHEARAQGGARVCFFHADINRRLAVNLALAQELARAIHVGELELHYQPQIDARSGAMVGLEALLRWHHPQRGTLAPAAFLPVAEESGLIGDLGEWTVNAACRQIASWRAQGRAFGRVALNVSAQEFRHTRVIGSFEQAMRRHGIAAGDLEVEITEDVLLADTPTTREVLERLRALGIALVIDDFGAGASSLAWLKRMRPAKLKIDASFVQHLHTQEEDRALAAAIIGLGRALGLAVVAEGVELEAQRRVLLEDGCALMQGFLISTPLSVDALEMTYLVGRAAAQDLKV